MVNHSKPHGYANTHAQGQILVLKLVILIPRGIEQFLLLRTYSENHSTSCTYNDMWRIERGCVECIFFDRQRDKNYFSI